MIDVRELNGATLAALQEGAKSRVDGLLRAGIESAVEDAKKAEARGFKVNLSVEVAPMKEAYGSPGPLALIVKAQTVVEMKRKSETKPMKIAQGPLLPGIAEDGEEIGE